MGADINAMATHAWMAAPLHFVCGLGPRKARALLAVSQHCRHQQHKPGVCLHALVVDRVIHHGKLCRPPSPSSLLT